MAKSKGPRKKLVDDLKAKLKGMPKHDRKAFLRGWMQADRVYHGPSRTKVDLDE